MKIGIKWILIVIIITIIVNLVSCGSCDNKFINLLGSGSLGSSITLTNGAVHIDTTGVYDWYNGALFDGNNYYITGWQDDGTKKYAIIKINPDLTLNYAKYYTASGASDIGLTNSFFNLNDNTKLYVGGWYNGISGDGIIGEINKNTGNLSILKSVFWNRANSVNNRCYKFIWSKLEWIYNEVKFK